MFGKGALIFVAGFAMVFGLYTAKLNKLAVGASDNFNYHYVNQLVHENAMTAMNMAINDPQNQETIFRDIPCPLAEIETGSGPPRRAGGFIRSSRLS